jgi:phosphatidylethanolamine-binding protein (PEBP) family uncharacterized protein
MRTISNAITCSLVLAALALTGCSYGGSDSSSATAASSGRPPSIELASPALAGTQAIPRRYTCDGQDVSLPLQWSSVPPTTQELLLVMLSLTREHLSESAVREKISVLWAVAGMQPILHKLAAGRLPPGAILGRSASGDSRYSVCPAGRTSGDYVLMLFAVPSKLSLRPGFSDNSLFAQLSETKPPYGQLVATYART